MTAGSDLRKIDGRCAACGCWLSGLWRKSFVTGIAQGECINVECDLWHITQDLRRPVSVCGVVRDAAARAGL